MAGGGVDDGSTYSPKVGAIYVFNLIVGAGALGLPKAFSEAGYIAGSILLLILAILSFMTVTFMVESMAIGNAITKLKATAMQSIQQPAETDLLLPSKPTESSSYSITKRMEMVVLVISDHFVPPHTADLFHNHRPRSQSSSLTRRE